LYPRTRLVLRRAAHSAAPFTLLLLGNLRTFPLMLPLVAGLSWQYAGRAWLTLAVVAERVQHTDRSWWMKQVRAWLTLAVVAERVQHTDRSWWMKQVRGGAWLTLAVVAERVQHTDRSWWMKQVGAWRCAHGIQPSGRTQLASRFSSTRS
jgi:hypothetical protein